MLRATLRLSAARRAPLRASVARFSTVREPADEALFPIIPVQTKLFINNKFVDGESGATFTTYNPGTGEALAEVAQASAADVDTAVQAAHKAFYEGPWRRMAPRERGECLYRLADLLAKNKEELAILESLDNGKTLNQSKQVDSNACSTILKYYAGWADKINGKTVPIGPAHTCHTVHEPVGVCGLIIPWNLPLIGVAAKLGPALTCGNTVVLKSAEQTPLTALRVAELVEEAGFPAGVVNILSGPGSTTGEAIIRHPLVDKVSFTGSVEVGKHIQRVAADSVKRVTLELGGNNAVIVCEDADLDSAAEYVHNGLFWNDAEACAAGSRIFIHDNVYDEFVEKQRKLAEARVVGNPFSESSQSGAQVSKQQFDKVMSYIEGAQKEGAELVCGGKRIGTKGYYIEPTVFKNCTDDMKVFNEEVFGPVMTLSRFSDIDDVVERANSTPYGLAAGVFTSNMKVGTDLVRRVRAGMVFWNCYHVVDISAPFGGFKQSGFGREGGEYGLQPYLEVKMVATSVE